MAVEISQITPDSVKVNNKVVYKDRHGNWVAVSELSTAEHNAFKTYHESYLKTDAPDPPLNTVAV